MISNPAREKFKNKKLMQPTEEILNIDFHVKRLCLRALKKCNGNRDRAAVILGISSRTLTRYIRMYHLKRVWDAGYVFYVEEKRELMAV